MPGIPINRKLANTRLANSYGGWIYCDGCGKNIGYLCYVTYDSFRFEYQCKCKNCGSVQISFNTVESSNMQTNELVAVKNRLCCPVDRSPLLTILGKKLDSYKYEVVCSKCSVKYRKEKTL